MDRKEWLTKYADLHDSRYISAWAKCVLPLPDGTAGSVILILKDECLGIYAPEGEDGVGQKLLSVDLTKASEIRHSQTAFSHEGRLRFVSGRKQFSFDQITDGIDGSEFIIGVTESAKGFTDRQPDEGDVPDPDEAADMLTEAKEVRRRRVAVMLVGLVAMLAWLVLAILSVGGRGEADGRDTLTFSVAVAGAAVTFVIILVTAVRAGRGISEVTEAEATLAKSVICNSPPPAGEVKKMYADRHYTTRLTVMGVAGTKSVYYILECPVGVKLEKVHTSALYESMEKLEPDLKGLYEI